MTKILDRLVPPARASMAALTVMLAVLITAPAAHGHGGVTIAQGSRDGVTILVQATDATTPSGAAAADISAVLSGPGTGPDADVVFWVRPDGSETFKSSPENDEAGVRHATIPVQGRGRWVDWDVSAVVTLADGSRIRVTNAPDSPPGPDPAAKPSADPAEDPAETAPATSPQAASEAADGAEVSDISGEDEGAPGWAIPSLIVLLVLGGLVLAIQRRRRGQNG